MTKFANVPVKRWIVAEVAGDNDDVFLQLSEHDRYAKATGALTAARAKSADGKFALLVEVPFGTP